MPSERSRTKKLIVAFHFQHANQAAWTCDSCRQSGLESKRRCGWIEEQSHEAPPIIWARNGVTADSCPKSLITPQSLAWIEEFFVWKRLGGTVSPEWPARKVEAFCVLEAELAKERNDDQR